MSDERKPLLSVGHDDEWRRKNERRDRGQPIGSEQRCALHQRQRIGQRIADEIPGKPRQNMPAQPFGDGERNREHEEPRNAIPPEAARNRRCCCPQQCQARREQRHRERQHPRELVRLDEKRFADPEQIEKEITEAEEPAGARRAAPARAGVDQPDENRKRQKEYGRSEDRRKSQRRKATRRHRDAARFQPLSAII